MSGWLSVVAVFGAQVGLGVLCSVSGHYALNREWSSAALYGLGMVLAALYVWTRTGVDVLVLDSGGVVSAAAAAGGAVVGLVLGAALLSSPDSVVGNKLTRQVKRHA